MALHPVTLLQDYLFKLQSRRLDTTDFHLECSARYLEAASRMDFSKTKEQIEREVRAEYLAAGKAVPAESHHGA